MDNEDAPLISLHLGYLTARASAIIRAHTGRSHARAERLDRDSVVSRG
jgi:hypothetical protein